MWHPTKGVIHLDGDLSSKESVGSSDVEEVVMWDHSLCSLKTFQRVVLILYGLKFKSPSLDAQSKLLLLFLDKDPCDYFNGGTKVSMSIAAARKELKGQRKSPPEVPSLLEHTPPASNFLNNAGNHAHCNGLSRVALDPQKESTMLVTGGSQTACNLQMKE